MRTIPKVMKDNIYSKQQASIKRFEFGTVVASVFDDMLTRSIPFYKEINKIIIDLLDYRFNEGDIIYDLGCSTGTTLLNIHKFLTEEKKTSNFKIIGIDNSPAMIKKAEEKFSLDNINDAILECSDLEKINFLESGLIIINYTLQFLPVQERKKLLQKAYKALRPGGILFISEKIRSDKPDICDLTQDLYYDFKRRNGYSELEIAQKREALEEFLIPFTMHEHENLLQKAGFTNSEMIFRWYNFASFIGLKP